jgi:glycosyltransferase involved in cell wall biosynthesis
MKKILILSYFFPPCNLPAALRSNGWARHLHEFGFYPIIITRSWDVPISNPVDVSRSSGINIVHEKHDYYEVYYLPYEANFRDRLFFAGRRNWLAGLRRLLTLLEIVSQNFTNAFIPYRNLYRFMKVFLRRNPEINLVVITGNPFSLFRWGFLVSRNKNIKWIADYRDDWNTSDLKQQLSFTEKLVMKMETRSERRWVKSAAVFTTVSDYYVKKIAALTGIKGHTVLNGYSEEDLLRAEERTSPHQFLLLYNGSLYASQPVEMFLDGFREFKRRQPEANARIIFAGLAYQTEQADRVKSLIRGIEKFVEIKSRLPRNEFLKIQNETHVLVLIAHENLRGIPSSKLYEYIGTGKPIMICPPDNDIMEETLKGYNLSYFCRSGMEVTNTLENLYALFQNNNYGKLKPDNQYVAQFSRRSQAKKMAGILSSVS